jgi:hypothetical protein
MANESDIMGKIKNLEAALELRTMERDALRGTVKKATVLMAKLEPLLASLEGRSAAAMASFEKLSVHDQFEHLNATNPEAAMHFFNKHRKELMTSTRSTRH